MESPNRIAEHARLRKALAELTQMSQDTGLYDLDIDPESVKRLSEMVFLTLYAEALESLTFPLPFIGPSSRPSAVIS